MLTTIQVLSGGTELEPCFAARYEVFLIGSRSLPPFAPVSGAFFSSARRREDQARVRSVISGGQFRRNGTPIVPMPRFT